MTQQPHDALFKASLTPEAARSLCRAVLPAELGQAIQGATLSPQPVSFVEDDLKELRSDVCYSATLSDCESLVYVLVEHQSSVDPLMPFRVLRYMVDLWSWWLSRQPNPPAKLPLVIPIVVYHGERPWSAPQSLAELVELPAVLGSPALNYVPDFCFQLDDLGQSTDEELRSRNAPPFASFAWILFRHTRDPKRGIEVWRQCFDLLSAVLRHSEWRSQLEKLVSYSLIRGLGAPNELREELRRLGGPDVEEVAVTAGEKLLEQGRAQGLQEGRKEGRKEGRLEGERRLLTRQLCRRLGLETLPADAQRRIDSAPEADLELWGERVLDASSLDEVFGG